MYVDGCEVNDEELCNCFFFFFKQKTAYEMRISDWSSDVCSSDLSAADWIGDKGGTYQTIGKVRYSGCSGKAIFQSIAIFHTGDFCAPMIQSSGTPSARAAAITRGSLGSRKISSWLW